MEQVARLVGVCPLTIRNWLNAGKFVKPLDLGIRQRLLWSKREVLAALARHRELVAAGGLIGMGKRL
jgi:hypothetical protein